MRIFGLHPFHCWHEVSISGRTVESHGGKKRQSAWAYERECCQCLGKQERVVLYKGTWMYPPLPEGVKDRPCVNDAEELD